MRGTSRARGVRAVCMAAVIAVASLAAGCGGEGSGSGAQSGGGGSLSIATGGTGGVYAVYGGGLADLVTKQLEGYRATAETTSASVDNLLLIGRKSSDVAFSLADTAIDGVEGREAFKEPVPTQALANIYSNYTHVVTLAGKPIESVEDLNGKTVSVGSPNSGTEVIAVRILEAAGLDPSKDIKRTQLGVEESVTALRDGSIDAFFWSGGLPTGSITDLATTDDMRLLPTTEYAPELNEKYGEAYEESSVEPGVYKGVDDAVDTIAVPNYLMVNEAMDEELAYQMTKLLYDQKEQLVKVHPEAEKLDPARGREIVSPVELHPGAQRYYDEAGK